jgi:hypothetical protein
MVEGLHESVRVRHRRHLNRFSLERRPARGGRVCLDRISRWISGASAGCRCGLPLSGWHAGRA